MDLVGHSLDEGAEEVGGDAPGGFFVQLDKGELGGPVDGHQEIELALSGMDLGDINMEVAERIGLELALARLLALDVRQPGHAMALQAAMQRGAGQVGDRGLQGIEAVIERQQGRAAEWAPLAASPAPFSPAAQARMGQSPLPCPLGPITPILIPSASGA